jgi:hypothetical protein
MNADAIAVFAATSINGETFLATIYRHSGEIVIRGKRFANFEIAYTCNGQPCQSSQVPAPIENRIYNAFNSGKRVGVL